MVNCAGKHFVARIFFHGHTLASDGRLIHIALPADHFTIHWQAVAGANNDDITHAYFAHRCLCDLAVTLHLRGLWHQFAQRIHRIASTIQRVVLARVTQREQEQQKGPFAPFAQNSRTRSREEHQHIGAELELTQRRDGFERDIVAACKITEDIKANRQPSGQAKESLAHKANQQEQPGQTH